MWNGNQTLTAKLAALKIGESFKLSDTVKKPSVRTAACRIGARIRIKDRIVTRVKGRTGGSRIWNQAV